MILAKLEVNSFTEQPPSLLTAEKLHDSDSWKDVVGRWLPGCIISFSLPQVVAVCLRLNLSYHALQAARTGTGSEVMIAFKTKHSQMEQSKTSFITKQRALTAPLSLQPPPMCCEYIHLHFQHRQGYGSYCRLYVSFLSRRSKVTSSERGSFLFLRTVIFPCSSSPKTQRKQKIRNTGTAFS